jgi:3-oxoacyl-[acyl-carrier protein] reductase
VIAFARNLSEDLAPEVRINSIAPGLIETDMIQEMAPSQRQAMTDATPMKRLGRAEEIAELAAFLLSERSSFTTGQCYIASGGRVTLP